MRLTPSQQAMVDDGCPPACFDKTSPWEPRLATPATTFITKAKIEDPATVKLLAELEEKKLEVKKKKSVPVVDRTGQRWDSRKAKWVDENEPRKPMISITTNTRGNTKMAKKEETVMTKKAYQDMTMAELVEIYNKSSGKPPIKKFETRTAGLKRLEALEIAGAIKEIKAAVESKPTKATKAGATEKTGILAEFKFRDDSPREKLLLALKEEMGKQVPLEKLASAVFGSKSTDNIQKVLVTWNGIPWRIEMFKLPYIATKTKTDLGLAKKK